MVRKGREGKKGVKGREWWRKVEEEEDRVGWEEKK